MKEIEKSDYKDVKRFFKIKWLVNNGISCFILWIIINIMIFFSFSKVSMLVTVLLIFVFSFFFGFLVTNDFKVNIEKWKKEYEDEINKHAEK